MTKRHTVPFISFRYRSTRSLQLGSRPSGVNQFVRDRMTIRFPLRRPGGNLPAVGTQRTNRRRRSKWRRGSGRNSACSLARQAQCGRLTNCKCRVCAVRLLCRPGPDAPFIGSKCNCAGNAARFRQAHVAFSRIGPDLTRRAFRIAHRAWRVARCDPRQYSDGSDPLKQAFDFSGMGKVRTGPQHGSRT